MPNKLHITDKAYARRHVLGQQLYRLRRRYRLLIRKDLPTTADTVLAIIRLKEAEYDHIGGRPKHRGNVP